MLEIDVYIAVHVILYENQHRELNTYVSEKKLTVGVTVITFLGFFAKTHLSRGTHLWSGSQRTFTVMNKTVLIPVFRNHY